jgi:hypothetical protein
MHCPSDLTTASPPGGPLMTSQLKHFSPEPDLNVSPTNVPYSRRFDTLPEITFAILVPDLERLQLFLRPERGRVRYRATILSPQQLLDQVSKIPEPSALVLAGNSLADRVSSTILPHRELYVVPDVWFRHITGRDPSSRARTAARLVHAHLLDPIQLRLSPFDDVPF